MQTCRPPAPAFVLKVSDKCDEREDLTAIPSNPKMCGAESRITVDSPARHRCSIAPLSFFLMPS
jgi:hypothetical protein